MLVIMVSFTVYIIYELITSWWKNTKMLRFTMCMHYSKPDAWNLIRNLLIETRYIHALPLHPFCATYKYSSIDLSSFLRASAPWQRRSSQILFFASVQEFATPKKIYRFIYTLRIHSSNLFLFYILVEEPPTKFHRYNLGCALAFGHPLQRNTFTYFHIYKNRTVICRRHSSFCPLPTSVECLRTTFAETSWARNYIHRTMSNGEFIAYLKRRFPDSVVT